VPEREKDYSEREEKRGKVVSFGTELRMGGTVSSRKENMCERCAMKEACSPHVDHNAGRGIQPGRESDVQLVMDPRRREEEKDSCTG